MKRQFQKIVLFALCTFFISSVCKSQVPYLFNYQGIARDAKGDPISNQAFSLKVSLFPSAEGSNAEYEEIQHVTTNEFGLYTLQIGNGNGINGSMKSVKWETGNKYIRIGIDPQGGTDYKDAGTTQLLTVPYALYAERAGNADDKKRAGAVNSNAAHVAGDINYLTKFTALNTIGKSIIFANGNSVGIGTSNPSALTKMHLRHNSGNIEHIRMQNDDSLDQICCLSDFL